DFVPNTCFTAGTLVHTKTGTKKIEEIQVGDVVASWNEETGAQEYNKVTATFVRETDEIYTLVFADGKQIETTWNHPFRRLLPEYKSAMSPTKLNSEWVDAKDLKAGDFTFTKDGKLLQIGFIQVDERDERVYNFTVENEHDYYVGEVGILVHNVDYGPMTGITLSPQVMSALLKLLPGATEAEIEAARKAIEIGNRPVDGTLEAAFDLAGYIDAACKNGCPPDIAMAPVRLGISAAKVAGELIRSGRFKEAIQVTAAATKNWFKGADSFGNSIPNKHGLPDINPGFPDIPGTTSNCTNCVIATDSTLAGQPASAMRLESGRPLSFLEDHYGKKFQNVNNLNDISDILSKAGSGSRGIIAGYRANGVEGHVFNAVNVNGKILFIDGQTGRIADVSSGQGFTKFKFLRTDN
ncbi:polymorphic toxin-type HINT domain-containing protein, partial [Leptospira kmetyi]|uniref:polymorphic toxin-type HINT domain-containing protein n=1 Tax=Leptospira kmetyi TaxID=408139 RepID=UPI001101107E